ncbi:CinA family protein [Aureimonas leprariae]|uniref:Nicotinamide-nucleotide amidohydrolase family protein n=1 Tax=Plantimonas leprariae TaxID=2615207 RepID=A0A7V7PRV3_9HYPH|nr:nicotinamide-nucleotide amidohydrolase family protein [Aureimonas leprariae]KAB0681764.1 nicotinamide-nucleotide amidohydrolase family protein [Aureimonas leprariae]
MIDERELNRRAARIVATYAASGMTIATAESCTGGMIAAQLTNVAGSSAVLDRGFVTYSNAAKTELLGVPADLIDRIGAVSKGVAQAMAEGALASARTTVAVAVTGIAGPGGGSETKPVGLVHFALARADGTRHEVCRFGPLSREEIRRLSVATAFDLLEEAAQAGDAGTP